jgi:hypothetical protein
MNTKERTDEMGVRLYQPYPETPWETVKTVYMLYQDITDSVILNDFDAKLSEVLTLLDDEHIKGDYLMMVFVNDILHSVTAKHK